MKKALEDLTSTTEVEKSPVLIRTPCRGIMTDTFHFYWSLPTSIVVIFSLFLHSFLPFSYFLHSIPPSLPLSPSLILPPALLFLSFPTLLYLFPNFPPPSSVHLHSHFLTPFLPSPPLQEDSSEAAKYELLHKRDQDMTAFMDKFEEVLYPLHSSSFHVSFHLSLLLRDKSTLFLSACLSNCLCSCLSVRLSV
jgi:hypothetical protein